MNQHGPPRREEVAELTKLRKLLDSAGVRTRMGNSVRHRHSHVLVYVFLIDVNVGSCGTLGYFFGTISVGNHDEILLGNEPNQPQKPKFLGPGSAIICPGKI